jgi:hypothetical protein
VNQRGSVVAYLLFSIAASIATGYGVYAVIRDNKSATPPPPTPRQLREETPPAPTPAPVVDEPPPPPPEQSLAQQRAVDPTVEAGDIISPVMGIPGIEGPIERGSVDRRMRAKSLALQSCWERNGDQRVTVRMTMLVDEDGRVTSATVSPGLTVATEACIISVLGSLSFTSPGKPAEVVQPIAFR